MSGYRVAIVTGRVQRVGYRVAAQKQAQKLGVNGWARNLPSGQVEVVYAVKSEECLQAFENWLSKGPLMAKVKSVAVEASDEELPQTPPRDAYIFSLQLIVDRYARELDLEKSFRLIRLFGAYIRSYCLLSHGH